MATLTFPILVTGQSPHSEWVTLSTADEAALPPLPPDPPYLCEDEGAEDEDEGSLAISANHISLVWAQGDGQGTEISAYVLQIRDASENSWREVSAVRTSRWELEWHCR